MALIRWWLLLGVLVAVAVACGGEGDEGVAHIAMRDNVFGRDLTRIGVGGTVEFSNDGRVPHNAVAVDGSWSTEGAFGELAMVSGDSVRMTFDTAGVYEYLCTFHAVEGEGMVATLVVGDLDDVTYGGDAAAAGPAPETWSGVTRNVPADHPTISEAVDAAGPGDLVLIQPGVYPEQVNVTTPGLVVRGADRNRVIIDGGFERTNGINVIGADGVAVENLTVRNTTGNGLLWASVEGYRASYVTSIDADVYGIYAFDSVDGLFEHSYASGSWDSGFYIGQCDPCRAVITDVVAEWNGLGYSGTNASGELWVVNSVWRNNVAGIVANTLDSELVPPVERVVIAGNLIHDQGTDGAPAGSAAWSAYGNGIIVAGGNEMLITRNRVVDSASNGIGIFPNLDERFWLSADNEVRDNIIEGSGAADIALAGPAGSGNCFEGNGDVMTSPVGLEVFQGCDGIRFPFRWSLGPTTESLGRIADASTGGLPDVDHGEAPKPGPQPQLPGGAEAAVVPAVDVYAGAVPDLDAIATPPLDDGAAVSMTKGPNVFGVHLATTAWSVFFGLWAYVMPFMLFAALFTLAVGDILRRRGDGDLSAAQAVGWVLGSLLIPFLAVIAYFVVGRSRVPTWLRVTLIGGGIAAYMVLLVAGALLGGIV
ncbi:MAG: right-handed parallel beta-helix repeat-containing protein [Acidimicrobiia bacterium]|nr:right-handed parallel beta-helix repeat-containing protein [Acidimicrobiia bacterium]